MRIAVIATPALYDAFTTCGITGEPVIERMEQPCTDDGYQAVIDFLFTPDAYTAAVINNPDTLFFFNAVTDIAESHPAHTIRFNGWPGFISGPLLEAASSNEADKLKAAFVLDFFSKKPEWVPDQPGFIAPRVLAAVINEAWLTLEDGVSTKEDIDTAMKLGTNYPFGPFEWTGMIGAGKLVSLLTKLAEKQSRYQPAPLLIKEAIQ